MKKIFAVFLALVLIISTIMMSISVVSAKDKKDKTEKIKEGTYYIENLMFNPQTKAHFVLEIQDESKDIGAKVIVAENKGTEAQIFKVSKVKNEKNVYSITNVNSGMSLYVNDGVLCQGKTVGLFQFEKYNDDWSYIKLKDSEDYLQVDDTQHMKIRKIFTAEKHDSLYLKWKLVSNKPVVGNGNKQTEYIYVIAIIGCVIIVIVLVSAIIFYRKRKKA